MSRTLTIPEELYDRLQAEARLRGLLTVEQLLEQQTGNGASLQERRQSVRLIDELRQRLFAKYGEMPDSAVLIREDRAR